MSSVEGIDRSSIMNNTKAAEHEYDVQHKEQHHEHEAQHEGKERQHEGDFGCGIGSCRPVPLQCCAQLLPFSVAYGVYVMVSQTISAYLSSQITTLEKRYGITSSNSGVILAANDIGYLVSVLFITHYCRRFVSFFS
ncbi:solute carrier organic anion transporter family member 3A1-like [Saccostrea echinata]|uniref:solute carrier organic anion transporter family member 3A1-like n=1 Tax=Saccostrea echinata TaxID=191078 RepID=UPI002A8413FD|nr:solute carrier organic anion transporter family member 3A1-like [Saccostrea echinata]